ncbi:MAG: RagB/SusD family nutrient uptake outer membrane protein [Chitinophagaceae bacterium]|nr:RagB/SusD family nutrient uptake outer membrane protein [Chitinophagaceae bacterium]
MKLVKIIVVFIFGTLLFACTKLDEKLRASLEVASSSVTAAGLLQSAYESMNVPFIDQSRFWAAQVHTTDEGIGPTRGPDWDDNGVWRVLHAHTWNADHGFLRDTYRELLQVQFAATSVLDKSPTPQQAAEARFIRALSIFAVLDGWNQVPYRADLTDLTKLPETLKGTAAADFIISELNAILTNLPDGPSIKANKDAARVLLMKTLLNKGVYANRQSPTFAAADMAQVVTLADQIINSGKYSFTANFFDTFAPDNYSNASKDNELIFALEATNGVRGCCNLNHWYCTLHYNQKPSGWNGFTTLSDFYDKYEATDKRRDDAYPGVTNVSGLRVGLLVGQQFDQNGVALKDRKGNNLSFTRAVKLKETGNDLEITGIRVIKYPPDYAKEFPSENEYVIFRYADVLLMKAEALLRSGNAAGALAIVNTVRTHPSRGVAALTSLSLDQLLDERGREFAWEGWRRNDLIRFGKFLNAWQEKAASGPERLLFAIPNEQLSVNPNLEQNPGYN